MYFLRNRRCSTALRAEKPVIDRCYTKKIRPKGDKFVGDVSIMRHTICPAVFLKLFSRVIPAVIFSLVGLARAETISVTLEAGPYEIRTDADGLNEIVMNGYKIQGVPGNPLLPAKVFNIVVPPDIAWDSLELTIADSESGILPETYAIRPAAPDAAGVGNGVIHDWAGNQNIADGKNMDVYGVDSFFPADYAKLLPYSQLRKWKYTKVQFFPFQYNPVTGKLKLYRKIKVEISFQRSGRKMSSQLLNDKVMDHLAPDLFYNYTSGKDNYVADRSSDQSNNGTYDYVIITTDAIVSNSANFAAFVTNKQHWGHSVLVVTETNFNSVTGQAPNHKAEKIRSWLTNNYSSLGIEYVLLIGDPTPYEGGEGDIPMKMCYPSLSQPEGYTNAPTDAFYADLTGNWDLDGDEYYGEWSDDTGGGGVDFSMEVWVGRIPVYSADYTTLNNILQKIMDYENSKDISWRKSALLPMGFQSSGYDGAPLAEQVMDDYLNAKSYSSWRQYQQGNGLCGPDSIYSGEEELLGGTVVRGRWASNDYGIVFWWAHGSATSASVGYDGCWDGTLFSSSYTSYLDDDHPSFTYQCSCLNGYPENNNNLQYAILKQGGIAAVSATRVSWFNTGVGYGEFDGCSVNGGIGYEYVDRLTDGLPAGRALYEGKLAVEPLSSYSRLMNQYDFNLYGDPAVGLNYPGCTITATAGLHGAISPSIALVTNGGSTNFQIDADEYYTIEDVRTNNASIGGSFGMTSTNYVWSNINTDGTVYASFAADLTTNGVPHWWLAMWGWTSNFNTVAVGNQDGDGQRTWEEYLGSTDPTNDASFFGVIEVGVQSRTNYLKWVSIGVDSNLPPLCVQRLTNVVNGVWATRDGNVPRAEGTNIWRDTDSATNNQLRLFYRLVATNSPAQ